MTYYPAREELREDPQAADNRIDNLSRQMDQHFKALDQKLDEVNRKFDQTNDKIDFALKLVHVHVANPSAHARRANG